MFDPEDSEATPSKADQAEPVSGFGLGVVSDEVLVGLSDVLDSA